MVTLLPTLMLVGGTKKSRAAVADYANEYELKLVFLGYLKSRLPESCFGVLILDRPYSGARELNLGPDRPSLADTEEHAVHTELAPEAASTRHFNHWFSAVTHPLLIADDIAYGLPSRVPGTALIRRVRRSALENGDELAEVLEEALGHAKRTYGLAVRLYQHRQVVHRLTRRQTAILKGVLRGELNKSLAVDLGVSKRLVELERAALLRLFEAPNSVALARQVAEAETFASLVGPDLANLPSECYSPH